MGKTIGVELLEWTPSNQKSAKMSLEITDRLTKIVYQSRTCTTNKMVCFHVFKLGIYSPVNKKKKKKKKVQSITKSFVEKKTL